MGDLLFGLFTVLGLAITAIIVAAAAKYLFKK